MEPQLQPPAPEPSAATEATPISAAEFAALMEPLWPGIAVPNLAVAVSGGPDSTALAYLLSQWVKARHGLLTVLTVDHGLRQAAAMEAQKVAQQWGGTVLHWTGDKPATRLMEAARNARYDLLIRECWNRGIRHLFLGHHQDDQAETIFFRLGRGSAWRGCVGIPRCSIRGEVNLLRPLLSLPKSRLIATCEAAGLSYISDPSNSNPKYLRAQWRAVMPKIKGLGFTSGALVAANQRDVSRRREELKGYQDLISSQKLRLFPQGYAEALLPYMEPHLLYEMIRLIGQAPYPPEYSAVQALFERGFGTLAGTQVQKVGDGMRIIREPASTPRLHLKPGDTEAYWDKRFRLRFSQPITATGYSIMALGPAPWRGFAMGPAADAFAELPGAVRASYPAIWRKQELVAIPNVFSTIGPLTADWCPWNNPFENCYG